MKMQDELSLTSYHVKKCQRMLGEMALVRVKVPYTFDFSRNVKDALKKPSRFFYNYKPDGS